MREACNVCKISSLIEYIFVLLQTLHQNEIPFSGIAALVFDTTTVNSGQNKGIVVRLQSEFGKNLLQLACRHHVYELVC